MSFFHRHINQNAEIPKPISPYGQRVRVRVDAEKDSERNVAGPGNLLSFMASDPLDDADVVEQDIAAQLPPENTVVHEDGFMDAPRKPIVSIHGKDVEEHDELRRPAA
jgi:hypothetical protein